MAPTTPPSNFTTDVSRGTGHASNDSATLQVLTTPCNALGSSPITHSIALLALAGCLDGGGSGDPADGPLDGAARADVGQFDVAVADGPPVVDGGKEPAPPPPMDLDAAPDTGSEAPPTSPCPRPSPDQPWIRDYQDALVAQLAGARALPAGGMLGVRQSASARTATRQFLVHRFEDINLTAQLHDYGSGQNVHARLEATAGGEETVVFGAHFDTVAGSPGANDNATGVAAVLSIARYLQTLPCRSRHVLLVLFDEEEDGLVGSRAFARKLRADGIEVHSVHTIDQMGWDMDGDRRIEVELPDRGLRELYVAAATDLGWTEPERAIVTTNVASTDHASFRPDFPAIGLTEEYRGGDTTPHYHRATDTYPTVDLDYLKHSTVLIHHVFADLVAPTPRFVHRLPRPQVIPRSAAEIDTRPRRPVP